MEKNIKGIFRFIIVGSAFSLIYAVLVVALVQFVHARPFITSIIIYFAIIPLAFFAQKKITFQSDQAGRFAIFVYAATQFFCLFATSLIASLLITNIFILDVGIYIATSGSSASLSYLICRIFIFKP
jgi:putative flippase GtrA